MDRTKKFNGAISRQLLVGLTLGCILALSTGVQAGDQLYRYINDKGGQVINDKIPPKFVARGYDIISGDGILIQRVPRQLTEEELRLHNTDESRARLKKQEDQRMRVWDESLMLRYSSIEDIEAAESRNMRDLQISISILKSNLNTIKNQIEQEQKKAADIERRGNTAPEEIISNIDILRFEIEDTEQSIAARGEEIDSIKASYRRDKERFNTLLDRVKLRSKASSSTKSRARSYY